MLETREGPMTEDAPQAARLDFEAFFRNEYSRLVRTMFLACGDAVEAEELAQSAMVRVFERWDRVSSAASPTAYAYSIAFNLNRSRLRRLAVSLRRRPDPPPPADPVQMASDRADTIAALRSLPERDREALVLVEWLGMSSEDAGRVLGIAAASVRGRIHRARRALREQFGEQDD